MKHLENPMVIGAEAPQPEYIDDSGLWHEPRNYYHTCPVCGANLDPGERCDCEEEDIHEQ